ncbi:MAG: DciA family protein [Candidatus Omnitrophica bacterium]|nr:DciA family protein [Candidatus Omnitrophota bacterium]
MENIKNTIQKIVGKLEENKQAKTIIEIWNSIIDEHTLNKTELENIKNGELIVKVKDSSTLYLLSIKKHKIIEQINEQTKEEKIKNIRFKIKP